MAALVKARPGIPAEEVRAMLLDAYRQVLGSDLKFMLTVAVGSSAVVDSVVENYLAEWTAWLDPETVDGG